MNSLSLKRLNFSVTPVEAGVKEAEKPYKAENPSGSRIKSGMTDVVTLRSSKDE
jgi:hypothetical protein